MTTNEKDTVQILEENLISKLFKNDVKKIEFNEC